MVCQGRRMDRRARLSSCEPAHALRRSRRGARFASRAITGSLSSRESPTGCTSLWHPGAAGELLDELPALPTIGGDRGLPVDLQPGAEELACRPATEGPPCYGARCSRTTP